MPSTVADTSVSPTAKPRLHRAIPAAGITFLALLIAAGVRSGPSVMMVPLVVHFGWSRATVAMTSGVGILLFGLVGPFAAALTLRIGIRRMMIAGLLLMAAGALASLTMRESWQYLATWGIISGLGSGAVSNVLGAIVVNRWFARHQGLVIGLLAASTSTGALVFLPLLAWLTRNGAWQPVALTVGAGCLLLALVVWLALAESPAAVGQYRFGEQHADPAPPTARPSPFHALEVLGTAARVPMFWLLAGTFMVCGLTTNGLVGTHMIAYCGDFGIAPVAAAGLLSLMGLVDIAGTTGSGWLTDRHDPLRLLVIYYGLRGAALIVLPWTGFNAAALMVFAVFYGLDWIATVPPTLALANRIFGRETAPIVFGWVMVAHQIGAAIAAWGAGVVREVWGSYAPAFIGAGLFGVLAALAVAAVAVAGRRGAGPGIKPLQA